ncbi:MAG: hypothetical protein FJX11_18330 [Alphaproteobacteria bacterium]|nr:hypothetical protein [Alphaproteobacteria bacterium]
MQLRLKHFAAGAALLAVAAAAAAATAGPVENLERERAIMLATLLDPNLAPGDRQAKVETAKARLADLERIVLRDSSLAGRNTPAVRRVFENYDLSFLVHAALEKNMAVVDVWFEQMGLTSANVLAARKGRK